MLASFISFEMKLGSIVCQTKKNTDQSHIAMYIQFNLLVLEVKGSFF